MSRPMWSVRLIQKGFPYSSWGAKLTRLPLLGRWLGRLLFEGDDIMLLSRRTVEVHEGVAREPSEVVPWQIVERFIERAGFLWIMNECICRSSMHCKEYPVDLGCLFLGEAARGINPALGRPVGKEEALEHLARCREAGLFHLVGRSRVDALWLKVGPGDRLLTICTCCTCCCLWRILPDLDERFSSHLRRMPGLEVRVSEACVGCATCLEANCLAGAIELVMDGAEDFISSAVDRLAQRVDVG